MPLRPNGKTAHRQVTPCGFFILDRGRLRFVWRQAQKSSRFTPVRLRQANQPTFGQAALAPFKFRYLSFVRSNQIGHLLQSEPTAFSPGLKIRCHFGIIAGIGDKASVSGQRKGAIAMPKGGPAKTVAGLLDLALEAILKCCRGYSFERI
jgi:hypothetical protein